MARTQSSNGSREVSCVRCKAPIQPYAGREVALSKYAHHPGQCADVATREELVRSGAAQGELFAWRCDRIDADPGRAGVVLCHEHGTDRAAFTRHMREHGAQEIKSAYALPRLRKRAPAAPRVAPIVPPFKFLTWREERRAPWQAGVGCELIAECERRGQFWSNADTPHSVWVIPLEPAPWEPQDRPARPVQLYLRGDGSVTTDWSEAKRSRRDARRSASYGRAA